MDDAASPVTGIKVTYVIDYGGTENFTKLITARENNKENENKNRNKTLLITPLKQHVGEYFIKTNITFDTLYMKESRVTELKVIVFNVGSRRPPPQTLGERVRFQILRISKKGAVMVKVKPKAMNGLLTKQLNNQSVSFYLQPYDRTEFESKPVYGLIDFQIMIEKLEFLSLPVMSEDTKFSSTGDLVIFNLKIDSVNEQVFKKYVTSRVRFAIINIIGRGPT